MKAIFPSAVLIILGAHFAAAQNVQEDPQPDPVLEAIREFSKRDKSLPNEVSVVLDPPADEPPVATAAADAPPLGWKPVDVFT